MASRAERIRVLEHEWWARIPQVLYRPVEVFTALRDDSPDAADARQEPLAAVVLTSGIAAFLAIGTAGGLYDDFGRNDDALLVAVQAIFAGTLFGLQNYWIGGGAVHLGLRWLGAGTDYRLARHIVGLALTPFVLSLVFVLPIQLALFGGDLFRTGGADDGAAGDVFRGIDAGLLVWAVVLAVIGVRTVHGWSWLRAIGAFGFAAFLIALLGLAAVIF
jgi:hypothetical protein